MKFRHFAVNYLSLIYIMVGYSFLIPFLPSLGNKLDVSVTMTGLLISGYAAGQFIFSPFAGEILSKYNKKNVLALSLLAYCFFNVMTFFSGSYFIILIFRFLTGIFAAGVFPAAETYVALETNRTNPKSVTKIALYLSSATSIGMALGPLMGLIVIKTHMMVMFLMMYTIFGILLSAAVFKILLASEKTNAVVSRSLLKSTVIELTNLFKERINRFLMLGFLVFGITCSGIEAYGLRYLYDMGYLSVAQIPFMELLILLCIIILYFLKLSHYIERKIPLVLQIKYTAIFASLLMFIGSLFSNISVFILSFGLSFLLLSLFASVLVTYITKETTHPARLLANKNSLTCIGMVIGPIITGFFYQIDVRIMFAPIILSLFVVSVYSLFVKNKY